MSHVDTFLSIVVSILTLTEFALGFFIKKNHDEVIDLRTKINMIDNSKHQNTVKAQNNGVANSGNNVSIRQ